MPQWNVYEAQLESWLAKHISTFLYGDVLGVWRQVPCSTGIADILALLDEHDGPRCYIIELKRGRLRNDDLCQVLRYAQAFRAEIGSETGNRLSWDDFAIAYGYPSFWDINVSGQERIQPVLIGESAPDRVVAAAHAAHVQVLVYDYSYRDGFSLSPTRMPRRAETHQQVAQNVARVFASAIGDDRGTTI